MQEEYTYSIKEGLKKHTYSTKNASKHHTYSVKPPTLIPFFLRYVNHTCKIQGTDGVLAVSYARPRLSKLLHLVQS